MKEASVRKTHSTGTKIVIIGFIGSALLIPVVLMMALIADREAARDTAVQEVSGMWGGRQTLGAVVLSVPYTVVTGLPGKETIRTAHLHLLPDELNIRTTMKPVIRTRSIYEVVLYSAHVDMRGTFRLTGGEDLFAIAQDIQWAHATLSIAISDPRGIAREIELQWDGSSIPVRPGTTTEGAVAQGVSAPVRIGPDAAGTDGYTFHISMSVRGSGDLLFVPAGKSTTVEAVSEWESPSFQGRFLPETRTVGDSGFSAAWSVSEFNRGFPGQWTGKRPELESAAFGVALYNPIDVYRLTMRSVKYAVLFIALTFGAFFLTETLLRVRLHAMHYILTGFAVTLFYLLLLALSEHVAFGVAYAAGAGAVTLLILVYMRPVLQSWKPAAIIAGVLAFLYGMLYVLLQMEDYALLAGSIVLFIALGTIMMLTRKMDWSGLKDDGVEAHKNEKPNARTL